MPARTRLGQLLRTARERAGISQAELGRRVAIAANHVARLESSAKTLPRFQTFARIAAELGLSLDQLAAACGYRGPVRLRPSDAAVTTKIIARLRKLLVVLDGGAEAVRSAMEAMERDAGSSDFSRSVRRPKR